MKSNNKNTNSQKPPTPPTPKDPGYYKLMIVGDQGQFEYFKKTYDDVKPLQISKQQKIDAIFKDVTYNVKDRKCIITFPDKKIMDLSDISKLDNRAMGMKNFHDLISTKNFQKHIDIADGIVFLGDTIYPESKKMMETNDKKNTKMYSQSKWNERLECAWNIFMAELKKIKLFENDKLDERLDILTGNHSYDVSFNKESDIVRGLKKRKENSEFYEWDENEKKAKKTTHENPTSYFYIKKLSIPATNGGRNVTFVDFNTGPFVCLAQSKNEADYNDPKVCGFDKYYMDRWSYTKTSEYYLTLFDIVSNLDINHWNVIRGHHPPSNYEDGDATFYWDVNINGQTYNLMEKFEERNVRVFLGSHIHGQAVMAVPFRKEQMRPRGDKISSTKDGSYCNVNNLKSNSTELMNVKDVCNQDKFDVDLDSEKLMIVFINGNSGRKFDPISNGLRSSRGNTVWAKNSHITVDEVKKEAFGFSFAEFEKDKLIFQFHEMNEKDKKIDTGVVSTFSVKFDSKESYNNATMLILAVVTILILLLVIAFGIKYFLDDRARKQIPLQTTGIDKDDKELALA